MSSSAPPRHALRATLALTVVAAGAAGLLAGCSASTLPVPAYAKDLPRLYISGVRYRVRGEVIGPGGTVSGLSDQVTELSKWKELGTFLGPLYAVHVDPEIIIQTTTNRTIPAEELVDATTFTATGGTTTQKVLRNPLFYLDYVEVKYNVPGYTLPTRNYNLNMAMKQTFAVIDHLPVSNADDVVKALWDKPDVTPPAVGTADITVFGRDMDPLLADKTTKALVTRSFPVRYMYGSALLGESVQNESPVAVPQPFVFGTPGPAATPSAAPAAPASPAAP